MNAILLQELSSKTLGSLEDATIHFKKNDRVDPVITISSKFLCSEDMIIKLFTEASCVLFEDNKDVFTHMYASYMKAHKLLEVLQKSFSSGVETSELTLLDILNQARVHLGLVYAILLTPTLVDPMQLSAAENTCRKSLVSDGQYFHNMQFQ